MALGMGTVFVFLGLLVIATSALSRIVADDDSRGGEPSAPEEIEEAVAAAVAVHRARQR